MTSTAMTAEDLFARPAPSLPCSRADPEELRPNYVVGFASIAMTILFTRHREPRSGVAIQCRIIVVGTASTQRH
jgi:hypothetical protein